MLDQTRIAYVADVHVGNPRKFGGPTTAGVNERAEHTLSALEAAVQRALDGGCVALGIAGDLFDYSNVEPQLVARVQKALAPIPTFAIPGNHDMTSMRVGDHAMAPLQDHVTLVERPTVLTIGDIDVICIPFEPGPPTEWLPARLEALDDPQYRRPVAGTHLMLHMGISDDATPYFLDNSVGHIRATDLRDLMDQFGIDCAFAGDWHRHQVWENISRTIVQVGCLAPNRFPPGKHEHGSIGPLVIAEDIDGVEMLDIPGPRFTKTHWSPTSDWPVRPANALTWYAKLVVSEPHEVKARKFADNLEADEVEIVVDRVQQRAAARTAAHEARCASSVDEAVRVYVDTMPLPDGVDRVNVLQRVRRFL